MERGLAANRNAFEECYSRPYWQFRFRYDTEIKKKSCLYALARTGKPLGAGNNVFELGFGTGRVLLSLPRDVGVYGGELSQTAVERATDVAKQLGFQKYEFREYAGGAFPVGTDSVDVAIASHVLEHVDDDCGVLAEFHRILKRHGRLVIAVPINEKYSDPKHIRRYDESILTQTLSKCGFAVKFAFENEYLFHLVEKFYWEDYKKRLGLLGELWAVAFNVPAALLPWSCVRVCEAILRSLGFAARQLVVVAERT